MVASLLKVISTGIQDERLQYDGKITAAPFYKIFRRSGRFTTQFYRIDFDNLPQFGQTAYFRIRRQGHLVQRLYLVATMPDLYSAFQMQRAAAAAIDPSGTLLPSYGWTNSLGHALIQEASIFFANERLDTFDSRLLEIMDEFNTTLEKTTAMNRLIKRNDSDYSVTSFGNTEYPNASLQPTQVIVPLPFWFARGDPAAALPTDAISRDEMRVMIRFRDINGLYYTDSRVSSAGSTAQGTSLYPLFNSQMYVTNNITGSLENGIYWKPPSYSYFTQPLVTALPGINSPLPQQLPLGDCYILAEYVYLDEPEAVAFRLGDLYVPMVQHYALDPVATRGASSAAVSLNIGNPVRDMYWMVQRVEAPTYNAHFLATRDLSSQSQPFAPWWPDSSGLSAIIPAYLKPGFAFSDSEPISAAAVVYEGTLVRTRSEAPPLYRTIIPVLEQKKSPWVNRYYYNYPFGIKNLYTPASRSQGEANLDKIKRRELRLQIAPRTGYFDTAIVNHFNIFTYIESYNILRIYGGRAGLLFAY
jgi:hypothetical protein